MPSARVQDTIPKLIVINAKKRSLLSELPTPRQHGTELRFDALIRFPEPDAKNLAPPVP